MNYYAYKQMQNELNKLKKEMQHLEEKKDFWYQQIQAHKKDAESWKKAFYQLAEYHPASTQTSPVQELPTLDSYANSTAP